MPHCLKFNLWYLLSVKKWKSFRRLKDCHSAQLMLPSFYNSALYTPVLLIKKQFEKESIHKWKIPFVSKTCFCKLKKLSPLLLHQFCFVFNRGDTIIVYIIEREQTMAHYCTHLCRQRTILYTITADKEVWTNLNMLAWVTNESVTNERLWSSNEWLQGCVFPDASERSERSSLEN